jgi:glycyl-radical enzyme activating protein
MNGLVLDVKRMAVHDGPGIRTTIFLKGCPLSCRWCHNPESVSAQPEIGLLSRKCVGCRRCAQVCPTGAHTFGADAHVLDHTRCTACGKCVEACLQGALERYGTEMPAEDAAAAALEDRTFYARSGGGCTLSGGEPLIQSQFCAEVLRLLHAEKIHCAVDTSGAVSWADFEAVLPYTDLFLYDLKHTDDALHRAQVGAPNAGILDNLRHLSACGVPIEIRIPTVPGFNADEASITAMGRFLADLPNITGVRLLPYHLARSKYETVGHPDTMPDVPPPDSAFMERAAAILQGLGLHPLL